MSDSSDDNSDLSIDQKSFLLDDVPDEPQDSTNVQNKLASKDKIRGCFLGAAYTR